MQLEQANEPAKAMEVCTTCGALLVLNDAHQRMDEHVVGKQHMGYAQIRAYIISRQQTTPMLPQELISSCLEPGESLDDSEVATMSTKKVCCVLLVIKIIFIYFKCLLFHVSRLS